MLANDKVSKRLKQNFNRTLLVVLSTSVLLNVANPVIASTGSASPVSGQERSDGVESGSPHVGFPTGIVVNQPQLSEIVDRPVGNSLMEKVDSFVLDIGHSPAGEARSKLAKFCRMTGTFLKDNWGSSEGMQSARVIVESVFHRLYGEIENLPVAEDNLELVRTDFPGHFRDIWRLVIGSKEKRTEPSPEKIESFKRRLNGLANELERTGPRTARDVGYKLRNLQSEVHNLLICPPEEQEQKWKKEIEAFKNFFKAFADGVREGTEMKEIHAQFERLFVQLEQAFASGIKEGVELNTIGAQFSELFKRFEQEFAKGVREGTERRAMNEAFERFVEELEGAFAEGIKEGQKPNNPRDDEAVWPSLDYGVAGVAGATGVGFFGFVGSLLSNLFSNIAAIFSGQGMRANPGVSYDQDLADRRMIDELEYNATEELRDQYRGVNPHRNNMRKLLNLIDRTGERVINNLRRLGVDSEDVLRTVSEIFDGFRVAARENSLIFSRRTLQNSLRFINPSFKDIWRITGEAVRNNTRPGLFAINRFKGRITDILGQNRDSGVLNLHISQGQKLRDLKDALANLFNQTT